MLQESSGSLIIRAFFRIFGAFLGFFEVFSLIIYIVMLAIGVLLLIKMGFARGQLPKIVLYVTLYAFIELLITISTLLMIMHTQINDIYTFLGIIGINSIITSLFILGLIRELKRTYDLLMN